MRQHGRTQPAPRTTLSVHRPTPHHPCNGPGEANGSAHMTTESWADISSDEETDEKIAATRLTSQVCAVRCQSVELSDDIVYYDIMPYAEIYPKHPSQIITTADGYKPIKPHADRWTGKSAKVMDDKRRKIWETRTLKNTRRRGANLYCDNWTATMHTLSARATSIPASLQLCSLLPSISKDVWRSDADISGR